MKFSVLIPAYNASKYIERCLESLINQTFQDFEIIVIDDGSKDDTLSKLECYQSKNERIRVYHQDNHGVAYTRNCLLDNAKGEWIVFVDSDDCVSENYLFYINNTIEICPSVEIVFCSYALETKKGVIKKPITKFTLESCCRDLIEKKNRLTPSVLWAKSFRRNIINEKKIRFSSDFNMGEDLFFLTQYLLKVKSIDFATNSIYYWNAINESSMTHSSVNYLNDNIRCYQAIIDIIRQYGLEKKYYCSTNIGKLVLQNSYYIYVRNNSINNKSPYVFIDIDYKGLNLVEKITLFAIDADFHFIVRCINCIIRWFHKVKRR